MKSVRKTRVSFSLLVKDELTATVFRLAVKFKSNWFFDRSNQVD